MQPEIRKIGDKFYIDYDTHEMVYDETGKYLGQYQDSVMDDGRIFILPDPHRAIKPLTAEQMAQKK